MSAYAATSCEDRLIALSEPSVRAGSSHRVVGAIKNIDTLLGADYGLLELFAASGKRTIFLDVLRHHFASKDGIIALSSLSLARVRRTA